MGNAGAAHSEIDSRAASARFTRECGSSLLTVLVSLSLLAALLAISMASISTTQTTIASGHQHQDLETSILSLLLTGKEIALDQRKTGTSTARDITNVIIAQEPRLIVSDS